MRTRGVAWSVGALLLLAGCGGSSLEADDPAGYEACRLHAESLEITDDPVMRLGSMFDVGEKASQADTEAIRDTATPVADSWIVDGEALEAACKANGVGS